MRPTLDQLMLAVDRLLAILRELNQILRAIYKWAFVIYLSVYVPTCVPKKQTV
jgi:hypothetical protein